MRTGTRTILAAVTTLAAILTAACGTDAATVGTVTPTAAPERQTLFLRGPEVLRVVDVDTGEVVVDAPAGVVPPDRSVVVGAAPTRSGADTDVVARSSVTGEEVGRVTVPGSVEPRVVSPQGDDVMLGPRREPFAGEVLAPGRLRTTLVVVGFDGGTARPLDVAANVEPEAFSTDGRAVIVVEYLPPEAPDRYRVARLDLASGQLSELESPDAVGGAEMRGTARTQALSPDGTRLYTLYSTATMPAPAAPGPGHGRASVHVLDLEEQWAHCVDLPRPFGSTPGAGFGVALGADGERLWVADSTAGLLAEVDTAALSVTRTAPMEPVGPRPVLSAGASGSPVFLAGGSTVTALDPESLAPGRTWSVDGEVSALRLLGDGRLAVVTGMEALLFATGDADADADNNADADAGDTGGAGGADAAEPLERLSLPVLEPVTSLDPTAPADQRGAYECAC